MPLYEIVNPSDMYTIETKDFLPACLAVLWLGQGKYALLGLDKGGETMPIFLFGGYESWFRDRFGKDVDLLIQEMPAADLAAALESVICGDREERLAYFTALDLLTDPDERRAYRDAWQQKHSTSLNDIGGDAHRMADRLRAAAAAGQIEAPPAGEEGSAP